MRTSELVTTTEPTPEQVQYLEDRIYEFNSGATGITDGEGLAIFVKDEQGRIVAGICGNTWGGCFEIRQFWVEERRRKQGLGTRLLGAAENEARRRGCRPPPYRPAGPVAPIRRAGARRHGGPCPHLDAYFLRSIWCDAST